MDKRVKASGQMITTIVKVFRGILSTVQWEYLNDTSICI